MVAPKIKKKNFVMKLRERELLAVLYHLRVATTSQLIRLFYQDNNERHARSRIAELVEFGYLKMENHSVIGDRQENRYFLANKGLEIALQEDAGPQFDLAGKRLSYTVRQNYVAETQQIHQILINEVFVRLIQEKSFTLSQEELPILQLMENDWLETRRCILKKNGAQLKPDASFRIGDAIFWVEVDRGTETLSHLRSKFKIYNQILFQQVQKESKHILLFCCDRNGMSDKALRKRVIDTRKIAMGTLDHYFDDCFEVYVDEYEALASLTIKDLIPIVKKEKQNHLDSFGPALRRWANEKGYESHVFKDFAQNPVQSNFKPAAWFQYQSSPKDAHWFIVESLHDVPVSVYSRLAQAFSYCWQFESETKMPLKTLVIADNEQDITELNHLFPDLKKVAYFTTLELWDEQQRFYLWERGKLKSEGAI